MTMHLEGPWLSTTGKKKGPKKWASAEAKRHTEMLKQQWEERLGTFKKLAPKFSARPPEPKRTGTLTSAGPRIPPGRETPHFPSRETAGGVATRPADKVYTGTKIKGIGTMHKSNAVPVFSDQEAIDISTMRR
jgi:hypothetical protein